MHLFFETASSDMFLRLRLNHESTCIILVCALWPVDSALRFVDCRPRIFSGYMHSTLPLLQPGKIRLYGRQSRVYFFMIPEKAAQPISRSAEYLGFQLRIRTYTNVRSRWNIAEDGFYQVRSA